MRQIAITLSVITFFALAFVGWCNDVPVFVCGTRAIAGAGIMYIVISLAGTAVISIIADAAVKPANDNTNAGKEQ
jgi:uncharacterized membrane protein YuzA (DUF378 family)